MRVLETQTNGVDLMTGMGFALESPVFANELGHRVAYGGGNGGSLRFVDFDGRMAVSFVMNRWIEEPYKQLWNQRILKARRRWISESSIEPTGLRLNARVATEGHPYIYAVGIKLRCWIHM